MSDELRFPNASERPDRDSIPETVRGLIRDTYAPPGGDAYWGGLESRIMARISSEGIGDGRWWNVLSPWAGAGLAAAAAIFAVAGLINRQIVEADNRVAYDSVVSAPAEALGATSELILVQDSPSDSDISAIAYYVSN